MRIVVTGSRGFIGRNLVVRLGELGHREVATPPHDVGLEALIDAVRDAQLVYHLAGVNRPQEPSEFTSGNRDFTRRLADALVAAGSQAAVVYASSTQATLDNPYGRSKRAAEEALLELARRHANRVTVFRLTNVFGKWCRPDYNSAVATFCHRIARDEPIRIDDPRSPLRLIHVDDVITILLGALGPQGLPQGLAEAGPVHETTVGEVAELLRRFRFSRQDLMSPPVGSGFVRALYATYVSYLPPIAFDYALERHADPRGVFVEMLKTPDCGQFSYFTAHPGVTRGGHYHHSKTEKFLVIQGTARFGFRHIVSGETHEVITRGGEARVVETVPGWTHDITNVGSDELIVMLWANEVFDRDRPDTVAMKVDA